MMSWADKQESPKSVPVRLKDGSDSGMGIELGQQVSVDESVTIRPPWRAETIGMTTG